MNYLYVIFFMFAPFFLLYGEGRAQESGGRWIKGMVQDEEGVPIIGVVVQIKGTPNGVTTDVDGKYALEVPENLWVLRYSFLGYDPVERRIQSTDSVINVVMKASVFKMREVVVVGYGTQSREKITSAITKLEPQALENVPYANALAALQGNVSGVQVQNISGQPGAAPRIVVRGGTSINNMNGAAPIYIVDGVIRNHLNDVNGNDIESIQILKDAASTAIYGARGSNGVVIVTTKSGRAEKIRATYSYGFTLSEAGKKYKLASGREYIDMNRRSMMYAARYNANAPDRLALAIGFGTGNDLTKNTAFTTQYLTEENKHKLNEGWESMPDPLDPSKTILFKDTDFQDLIYQTAWSHNHNLSVSGGSEKATLYAGLGYMNNEGTAITTKYRRLSFNLNGTLKLKENLSVTGRVMYTTSSDNEVFNLAAIFYRSAGTPPTTKYTYEDGTLAPGQKRDIGNPVYHLKNDKRKNSSDNLAISLSGSWEILPGLTFSPQFSLYKYTTDGYAFTPAYWSNSTTYDESRPANSSYTKYLQGQADLVLGYGKTFKEAHNLDVKVGFSYYGREDSGLKASGQGAATDLIPTLNASATPVSVDGHESDLVIAGGFARFNYDYKNRYLLSLSARYDGASNLGSDHKWAFFPAFSVGWNIHNESFMDDLYGMRLKLRGGYGVTGNISGLSDFQAEGEYGVVGVYAGVSAIQNTLIANPRLRWEQSRTLNVGLDAGIFNERLSIMFDWYRRVTDHLITSMSLPPSTGFSSMYTNLGSLENKGIELEVRANVLPSWSDVKWNIGINASMTKHKILRLPYNGIENNRIGGYNVWDPALGAYTWKGGLQEGGRVGDVYGYVIERIYATDEEAQADPVVNTLIPGNDKTKYGGYSKLLDLDQNGMIDSRDRVYLGNYYPKWNGGFTNSVRYKGLSFSFRFDFTTGHSIYNYARVFMDNQWQGDGNLTKERVQKSWKKQGDHASMPLYIWNGSYNLPGESNKYIEKGDFLCLREVTLGYTLPAKFLSKWGVKEVRFHVTGNNLHYFTKFKGLNPEEGGQDNGRYPIPRNFIAGLSITL